MVKGIHKVVLDVADQERAKQFWTKTMGFELVQDAEYGHERWLEVCAPDRSVSLVLGRTSAGPGDPAAVPAALPTSNVFFYCDDLPRTFEGLAARGVVFPQPPVRQPWGWWSMFEDGEGNRFALGQRAA